MTVASSTNPARNDYTGNGSTTVYNFTFPVIKESNRADNKEYSIKVIITENSIDTVKNETTDYTVTLNEDTRLGTITFGTAPTATQKITFVSDVDVSQATDYNNIGTGAFPADSHEKALDKLTILFRQFLEKENRGISLPESSSLSNLEIPISSDNSDKALVVNSNGDGLSVKNLADIGTAPVTDFAKTLLDDTTNTQARTTLDAEQKANSLTEKSSVVANDKFIIADSEDSNNSKKVALSNIVLAGEIKAWALSSVPSGYLECNGAEVAISSYGNLSTAIYVGDSNNADTDLVFGYKTDGSGTRSTSGTHIKLPDLRGEFIRGWDNGRGIDSGRKLGSYQAWAIENITGSLGSSRQYGSGSGAFSTTSGTGAPPGTGSASSSVTKIDFDASNVVNTASETRPRNISLMFIIKT
tara:strand:+ start:949 stop:2190 length:1242 start_codon:yes stop_codon:yes gene_type:complete